MIELLRMPCGCLARLEESSNMWYLNIWHCDGSEEHCEYVRARMTRHVMESKYGRGDNQDRCGIGQE